MADVSGTPFRETRFIPVDLSVSHRDDGTILVSSNVEPDTGFPHFLAYLRRHSELRPDKVWLAQRDAKTGDWRKVSYAMARRIVDGLTQGLLDMELSKDRPLAILSENSIEHALIMLAAMQASVPVAPISPAASLQSQDFSRLKAMVDQIEPQLFFVQSKAPFEKALSALGVDASRIITADENARNCVSYTALAATAVTPAVEKAYDAIDPDATAKFMLTSGSTGVPKVVPQTHRQILAGVLPHIQAFGHDEERSMVRLDWAPWYHVMGAVSLAQTLVVGGTFYIDDGKPVPPFLDQTLRNLREISTTSYGCVPAGYAAILDALEMDDELAQTFFRDIEHLAYAGARMPDDIANRLQQQAVKHTGRRIPFVSGFGATETGPTGCFVHWPTDRVGLMGLPHPSVTLKLVPMPDGRYEVRMKSPGVMNGYYGRPDLNEQAFDEEGFYKLGDAATLVDQNDLSKGLLFAGRIAEEFKLQTGTFVKAGALRVSVLEATAPYLKAAVVCGQDEPFVGLLAWINPAAARELANTPDATLAESNRSPLVRAKIADKLAEYNAKNPGSSTRIARFKLLDTPPSADRGEVTDKGEVSQRTIQRERAEDVRHLFQTPPPDNVIIVDEN